MESVVEFPDGGSLSIELVEQSRNAFNMFDKDGSGRIDLEEMKLAVKHLGCDAEEAEDLFLAMDENCDGEVDFDEFLKVMAFSVRQGDTSFAQSNNSSDAAGSNDPNLVTIPPPNMMEAAMQAFRLFRVNSTRQYRAEGDRAMYTRAAIKKRKQIRSDPIIIGWLDRFWRKLLSTDASSIDTCSVAEPSIHRSTYIDFQVKMHKLLFDDDDFDVVEATASAQEEWEREMKEELKTAKNCGHRDRKTALARMSRHRFYESLYETVDIWTPTLELKGYLGTFGHIFQNLTYLWEGDDKHERGKIRTLEDIRSIHSTTYEEEVDGGLEPPTYSAGPPAAREPPESAMLSNLDEEISNLENNVTARQSKLDSIGNRCTDSIEGWGDFLQDERATESNQRSSHQIDDDASSPPPILDWPGHQSTDTIRQPAVPKAPELGAKRARVRALERAPDFPVRHLDRSETWEAARTVMASLLSPTEGSPKIGETPISDKKTFQRAMASAQAKGASLPRPNMRTSVWGCSDPRPLSAQFDDKSEKWRIGPESPEQDATITASTPEALQNVSQNQKQTPEDHSDVLSSLLTSQIEKGAGLTEMEALFGVSSEYIKAKERAVEPCAEGRSLPGGASETDEESVRSLLEWASQLNTEDDEFLGEQKVELPAARRSPMEVAQPSVSHGILEQVRHRIAAAAYSFGGQDISKLFDQIDTSDDGFLDLGEFHSFARRVLHLSWSDVVGEHLDLVFAIIDTNASGTIGYDEVVNFLSMGDHWHGYDSPHKCNSLAHHERIILPGANIPAMSMKVDGSATNYDAKATEEASLTTHFSSVSSLSSVPNATQSRYLFPAGIDSMSVVTAHAADFEASRAKTRFTNKFWVSGLKKPVLLELQVDKRGESGCLANAFTSRDEWTRRCVEKDRAVYPSLPEILEQAKAASSVYDPKVNCAAPYETDSVAISSVGGAIPQPPSCGSSHSFRHRRSPRNGNIGPGKKVAILSAFAYPSCQASV